jgi:hypothetical protein
MTDPVKLLQGMARVSRSIGIWAHYYDSDVILGKEHLSKKFSKEPKRERVGTREITSYRQSYLEALDWSGFCGGSEPTHGEKSYVEIKSNSSSDVKKVKHSDGKGIAKWQWSPDCSKIRADLDRICRCPSKAADADVR